MSNWVRSLVAVKVSLVLLIVAAHLGWVRLGEVSLLAADPEKGRQSKAPQPEKAKGEGQGFDQVAANEKEVEPGRGEAVSSDLQRLLEIPKVQADSLKGREREAFLRRAEGAKHEVEQRLQALSQRIALLQGIEKSIDAKLEKIAAEKSFLEASWQKELEIQGDRLTTLVALYEKMEPKKAGPLLAELDQDLVVGLFKKLKQKTVTKFLESMPPEKAVAMTEYFGRISSGKEYQLLREINESLRDEFAVCKGAAGEGKSSKDSPVTPSEPQAPVPAALEQGVQPLEI